MGLLYDETAGKTMASFPVISWRHSLQDKESINMPFSRRKFVPIMILLWCMLWEDTEHKILYD